MKAEIQQNQLIIDLEEELTIGIIAAELHQIRSLSENVNQIRIVGTSVNQLDTTGIQFVLSIINTAKKRGLDLVPMELSEAFKNGCRLFGVKIQ